MGTLANSTDAENKLEDLSGIVLKPGESPHQAFIQACDDDHKTIQALYQAHRLRRNAQQKDKFLSPSYQGLIIDQTLRRLEDPTLEPGFRDERHCLVLWARPPHHILTLASKVQTMLHAASPQVWLMPVTRMHMTTLEVAFSKTPDEIDSLVTALRPALSSLTRYTHTHRSRLLKPMVSYDLSAFALSFLPASGEKSASLPPVPPDTARREGRVVEGDGYTYHHLRRDVFAQVQGQGVDVASRYQVPSAHITLGRYLAEEGHDTAEKREAWVRAIEGVNAWLEEEVWGTEAGEWIVGQEKGLDARNGALWYGGGRTIMLGEGF